MGNHERKEYIAVQTDTYLWDQSITDHEVETKWKREYEYDRSFLPNPGLWYIRYHDISEGTLKTIEEREPNSNARFFNSLMALLPPCFGFAHGCQIYLVI